MGLGCGKNADVDGYQRWGGQGKQEKNKIIDWGPTKKEGSWRAINMQILQRTRTNAREEGPGFFGGLGVGVKVPIMNCQDDFRKQKSPLYSFDGSWVGWGWDNPLPLKQKVLARRGYYSFARSYPCVSRTRARQDRPRARDLTLLGLRHPPTLPRFPFPHRRLGCLWDPPGGSKERR